MVALGCKVSRADAAAVERRLMAAGLERATDGEAASLCVVAGCAVTGVAEGKSRRAIRRIARENPGSTVVAAGCIAEIGAASRAAGADVLLPPGRTDAILDALDGAGLGGEIVESDARAPGGTDMRFPGRTRAFLKVQDGCDGACAYCIVPGLRGPSRSRTANEVLEEARGLVGAGHAEIVLAGVRLGSYADPGSGADLVALVESLLELRACGLVRLRLSSIEPMDFDELLAEIAASGAGLCPHFHLPLQSADDKVLSRMNRPYRAAEFRAVVERIRTLVPDAAVTTDVIAGFPGESADAHERTIGFIRETGFARVHAFPFSPRPGTPAAGMRREPSVEIARARAADIIETGSETARQYRSQFVGREVDVIAEPGGDTGLRGYTERYVSVRFAGPPRLVGSLVRVKATRHTASGLAGEIVGEIAGEIAQ
jgi:threonylcarbamoyladenosine tRNA methylthiotransferase MtaB